MSKRRTTAGALVAGLALVAAATGAGVGAATDAGRAEDRSPAVAQVLGTVRSAVAGPPRFVTGVIPLRNARVGAPYSASVSGLVVGAKGAKRFAREGGPSWVRIARDGAVSGRPDRAGTTSVVVKVTDGVGRTARATVRIRVRPETGKLVPQLNVMTFNMWYGGTVVNNAREKQLRFLLKRDVDIVGLQEQYWNSSKELAKSLGWYAYSAGYDNGIISRYPLTALHTVTNKDNQVIGAGARVRIDDRTRRSVVIWNAHLEFDPYGPYEMCFGRKSVADVMKAEKRSRRGEQIRRILGSMEPYLRNKNTEPVLLTGDFNSPSHLDYTPAAAREHCGYGRFAWPSSVEPQKWGLIDSFRKVHPDPVRAPGKSWSSVEKKFRGWPPYEGEKYVGRPEPQDRVDFIHYAGRGLVPRTSIPVMEGTPKLYGKHQNNEWTSDHRAFLTTFTVR